MARVGSTTISSQLARTSCAPSHRARRCRRRSRRRCGGTCRDRPARGAIFDRSPFASVWATASTRSSAATRGGTPRSRRGLRLRGSTAGRGARRSRRPSPRGSSRQQRAELDELRTADEIVGGASASRRACGIPPPLTGRSATASSRCAGLRHLEVDRRVVDGDTEIGLGEDVVDVLAAVPERAAVAQRCAVLVSGAQPQLRSSVGGPRILHDPRRLSPLTACAIPRVRHRGLASWPDSGAAPVPALGDRVALVVVGRELRRRPTPSERAP